MKKQTAMALAAVFAMSVAGTALAAPANPFVDVPAKHWAYDSLNKLAQAGVVSGYGDGTYKGDKTLTRYEVATIVAKAMANSEKADAASQKEIEALKAEFGTELNNLGVRVDNLESRIDNVKLTGNIRMRYEDSKIEQVGKKDVSTSTMKARARIYGEAKVNDEWKANFRLEGVQDMRTSGTDSDDDTINLLSVTGPLFGTEATFGRYEVVPNQGTLLDTTIDGAMFKFGNKLKTTVIYGKSDIPGQAASLGDLKFDESDDEARIDADIYGVVFNYSPSKATNLGAGYYVLESEAFKTEDEIKDNQLKLVEFAVDTKVAKNLIVKGSYVSSDAKKYDTSYTGGLWYKGTKIQDKGSFGVWAQYIKLEPNATWDSTLDFAEGYKGIDIGFDYALQKNIKLQTRYFDGENCENANKDKKFIRSQVEFFF